MKEERTWPHRLLSWFDGNRRDLPWREGNPRNPYDVWISEIMLQQTRTETVKPYFERWKELFPTVEALADAEESDVLHAWQGLGYYSRARNLHKAAKEIVTRYGGRLPKEKKELLTLPGIGDYTAGAIASIAYGEREAAIDGNVLRVYARLYGIHHDILKKEGRKEIEKHIAQTLPKRAGDFNEALMDLGADICIPKHPRCDRCPVRSDCVALRTGETETLPYRTPKKKQEEQEAICAVVIEDGKVLLRQRPATGMLASMWECPMILSHEVTEGRKELEHFLSGTAEEKIWEYTHVFTHRIWHMKAYLFSGVTVPAGYRWFTPFEYEKIPLAGPHAKLLAYVKKYIT